MMHLLEGNRVAAEFDGNPSLAVWLIAHPETHDCVFDGQVYRVRFREPWRLLTWPDNRRG